MSRKRTVLAGVYMIRVIPTNKVYIGSTKNIHKRIKEHIWLAQSDAAYTKRKRSIHEAIREYGPDNIEVTILHSGPEFSDPDVRTAAEIEAIFKYNAYDPKYGYNEATWCTPSHFTPRKQSTQEKTKRAKAVFLYSIKDDSCEMFFGGAKAVGMYLGYPKEKQYGKDVISHARIRGCLIQKEYFVVFADRKLRHEQLDELRESKNSRTRGCAVHRAKATLKIYEKAVKRIDEIAEEYFGL